MQTYLLYALLALSRSSCVGAPCVASLKLVLGVDAADAAGGLGSNEQIIIQLMHKSVNTQTQKSNYVCLWVNTVCGSMRLHGDEVAGPSLLTSHFNLDLHNGGVNFRRVHPSIVSVQVTGLDSYPMFHCSSSSAWRTNIQEKKTKTKTAGRHTTELVDGYTDMFIQIIQNDKETKDK